MLTERWQAEHEAKWAGSKARDPAGRLYDQRGFTETRESLRWLGIRQSNEHRNHGRYNPDLRGMFPVDGIGRMQRLGCRAVDEPRLRIGSRASYDGSDGRSGGGAERKGSWPP